MADPIVSVIIPCFNAEKYIAQTIESVLSQTYTKIEIIAIDDGSTDLTVNILNSFLPKITVFQHEDGLNYGQASALNLGIEISNGEYIAFLDADDIFYPKKIERQVEALKANSKTDLVYTNGHAINYKGQILCKLFKENFIEENIIGRMLLDCYISAGCSSILVRRSLLDKVGVFNQQIRFAKDHDMWIRMSEVGRFHYLSECLMAYRRHPGQLSESRKQWEDGFGVLKNASKRYPYSFVLILKRRAVLFYRLGIHDLNSKKYLLSIINLGLAFLHDPWRALSFLAKK